MVIITKSAKSATSDKNPMSAHILAGTKKEVKEYCQWVGFKDCGHLYIESAKTIFVKDKECQEFKKHRVQDE